MQHFMVDLETMGIKNNAAIVSIGVTEFDETSLGRNFYINVALETCLEVGLRQDESTVKWWSEQSEEARAAWQTDRRDLTYALTQLNRYLELATGGMSSARIWGNGAGFDNTLLKSAYEALEVDEPWKFYNSRCFRTMKSVFPLSPEETPSRVGTYHNALDDAITQALHLQAICKKYGIKLQ